MKKLLIIIYLCPFLLFSCSNVEENPNNNNNNNGTNPVLDEDIITNDEQLATVRSVAVGNTVQLSVTTSDPFATINWNTPAGSFDDASSHTVTWTPPNIDIARRFTIDVTVTLDNGNFDTASIEMVVYVEGGRFTLDTLFADGSWQEQGTTELCALAYDPATDNMFIIKCTQNDNTVYRYNFTTQLVNSVFTYASQWDYGARVIDGNLYIARSYDKTVLRLSNLSANTLTQVGNYGSTLTTSELSEINDVAVINSNVYFVTGNMITSAQHNGIQYLEAPEYLNVVEVLNPVDAAWQNADFAYFRSLVSTNDGTIDRLAINTGTSQGVIEIRDTAGNFIKEYTNKANAYLQKDSQDRVYILNADGTATRWSPDFNSEETLNLDPSPNYFYTRYIVREFGPQVEIISTGFRDREPVFLRSTVSVQ